jgi:hypothetical protein
MQLPEVVRLAASGSAAGVTWLLIAFFVPRLIGDELTWMISVVRSRIQLKLSEQKAAERALL